MFNLIFTVYRFIFARVFFYKINKFLYRCSLSGLGILNYENQNISGEIYFLNKYIKKNTTIFDVGANIGLYSEDILKIQKDVKIYAFEPHPKNFDILNKKNINIQSFNNAISEIECELTIYDYKNIATGHASLYRDVLVDIHNSNDVDAFKVKALTIDGFCEENSIIYIDLLKIDVEGHELNVLKGAREMILNNKIKIIHFEFNEMNVVSHVFMRNFFETLSNYDFYRLLPKGMLPLNRKNILMNEIFAYQNIVAILK
jgi:FkbM family methyltransferase